MGYYEQTKGSLQISTDDFSEISIKVTCYKGTIAGTIFDNIITHCGGKNMVGSDGSLKGNSKTFICGTRNPMDKSIKVKHTFINEDDEILLTYTVPDDHNGSPQYDKDDKLPSFEFTIDFI